MKTVKVLLTCFALGSLIGIAGEAHSEEPLKIAIALGPGKSQLAEFQKYVEANYNVKCQVVEAEKSKKPKGSDQHAATPFKGIEALDNCDVILSNLYRTWAPPEQLEQIKKHFRGKPVVGLRKAHHGFQNWLDADKEVFGVDYGGHYGIKSGEIAIAEDQKDNPLLKGLDPFLPGGGCYTHRDVAGDVEVLMIGGPKGKEPHPQTWTRVNKDSGQRVFYTRYDPKDLENAGARDMVIRALFWAANRELPAAKTN